MSRISKTFRQLKKEGRKALIPFITAGDPSLKETEKLIFTLEKAGVDIIELGVPFSDPMADGAVIQAASERALKKKVTLSDILNLVARVRKKTQIPILLMGYYNPIFVMGEETFAQKAAQSGVDALLIVDCPPEESHSLRKALRIHSIDLVYLLAPTSDEKRIKLATQNASGFIYYVSLTGVTGAKLQVTDEIKAQVDKIRAVKKIPVCVGFGISTPNQAAQIAPLADGVVIGSVLVNLIFHKTHGSQTNHTKVHQFISKFRHLF
ncbi:MAG TPA: tryptophan synthase subunit alpha [Deltaproteobacteria bacterium]|nr:MAG: tryptophan synthase subunit alpha [Deltaproteobacteria bacterium GWA2_45_12]HBF13935.1 tryptophan synthase subunit alpha [Deltaproteobacteria bacterium]